MFYVNFPTINVSCGKGFIAMRLIVTGFSKEKKNADCDSVVCAMEFVYLL